MALSTMMRHFKEMRNALAPSQPKQPTTAHQPARPSVLDVNALTGAPSLVSLRRARPFPSPTPMPTRRWSQRHNCTCNPPRHSTFQLSWRSRALQSIRRPNRTRKRFCYLHRPRRTRRCAFQLLKVGPLCRSPWCPPRCTHLLHSPRPSLQRLCRRYLFNWQRLRLWRCPSRICSLQPSPQRTRRLWFPK